MVFLLLFNLCFLFQIQKTLHKVIFYNVFCWIRIRIKKAAGSRSALGSTAGSGSAKNECGSTAPRLKIFNKQNIYLLHSMLEYKVGNKMDMYCSAISCN